KLQSVCRNVEKKYGLKSENYLDNSKDKNRPTNLIKNNEKAQNMEAHQGQQSFLGYVVEKKSFIFETLENLATWGEFHSGLRKIGIEVKLRGRGLVFKDKFSEKMVKCSDVDRELNFGKLAKRLGDFIAISDKEETLTPNSEKYTSKPLYNSKNKELLYQNYKAEMAERKTALEKINQEEKEGYQTIKTKWKENKKASEKYPMLRHHRQKFMLKLKIMEETEILDFRQEFNEKRKAVREERPYTSWTSFLQFKAKQGNENALEVLRTKSKI
ncbi:MAG: hypothetical protein LBS83_03540, partial [Holosporales bacterium]|nr:hypothetical protein [Holosporales bacterium]